MTTRATSTAASHVAIAPAKTLGQIAHDAGATAGHWARTWANMGDTQRAEWEVIGAAVAAAVAQKTAVAPSEIERVPHAAKAPDAQGTHGPGCATWGGRHYECAMSERALLLEALREADLQMDHCDSPTAWREKWGYLYGVGP